MPRDDSQIPSHALATLSTELDSLEERRGKYVSGLAIRIIVCVVFGAVFGGYAYAGTAGTRPFFLAAIAVLVFLGLINWPFWVVGARRQFPLRDFYVHWAVDLVSVTVLLHWLGGIELPYGSVGYMIMILTSATFLSARASLVVAGGSAVCFDALVGLEMSGWIPHYGHMWSHKYTPQVQLFIIVSTNVIFFLFSYLAGSLAAQLRHAALHLVDANRRLQVAQDQLRTFNAKLAGDVRARTAVVEQKNREIEEFIYIVTHDLRNVSTASAEVARRLLGTEGDRLTPKGQKYARALVEDARDMNVMLRNLLLIFKLEHAEESGEKVALRDLVEDIAAGVNKRSPNERVNVQVGEVPACQVSGLFVRHILGNLVSNAVKYSGDTAPPLVVVSARLDGGGVEICVRDNGIGIEREQLERVFDLYHRGPRQMVAGQEVEGYGVGLAMAKRLVERLGGRIWAESEVGKGTTVKVFLPA